MIDDLLNTQNIPRRKRSTKHMRRPRIKKPASLLAFLKKDTPQSSNHPPREPRKKHKEPPENRVNPLFYAAAFVPFLFFLAFFFINVTSIDSSNDLRSLLSMQEATASSISFSSSFEDSEPLGTGLVRKERIKDLEHVVGDGETLSEIAYAYDLNYLELAYYNELTNPNYLRPGTRLEIPSFENEKILKKDYDSYAETVALTTERQTRSAPAVNDIRIKVNSEYDGSSVTAEFLVTKPKDHDFANYEWHLGSGKKSFKKKTFWTYNQPGTYKVSLLVRDKTGNVIKSNQVYIDVPHPGMIRNENQHYVTLNKVNDTFLVKGEIVQVKNYTSPQAAPFREVKMSQDDIEMHINAPETGLSADSVEIPRHERVYRALKSGYYNITVESADGSLSKIYLYVSTFASRHADRNDINWYRTQFNTGTSSNCGPSTVSMAIAWAKAEYVPVISIREKVGWQSDGGTSYADLRGVMRQYGVSSKIMYTGTANDLFKIIDRGNIAIVLIHTSDISKNPDDTSKSSIGRYYDDSVGHYIIIKGYSLDKKYFIVHDPIPSDWVSNAFRQNDGISMIGKNRYYPAAELYNALRRRDVIEIDR